MVRPGRSRSDSAGGRKVPFWLMGHPTVRRLALVAASVLLALVWYRPVIPSGVAVTAERPMVGYGPAGTGAAAAVVRQSHAGFSVHGTRPEHGKGLVVAGALVTLLALLRLVLWGPSDGPRAAPSSLARRRHVIALRAPPLPLLV
jgi:hypothetical protein